MGNEVAVLDKTEKEAIDFANFLNQRKRKSHIPSQKSERVSFSPQIKWRHDLISILETMGQQDKWSELCEDIKEVVKQIKPQSFIKAISILNAINSNEVLELKNKQVLKDSFGSFNHQGCRQSQNVFLEVDKRYQHLNTKDNLNGKDSVSTVFSLEQSPERKKDKASKVQKKNVIAIINKQINQYYHPFHDIKESFMMIFQMKYRDKLDQLTEYSEKTKDRIYEMMNKDLDFYTEFISRGCGVYKKWIIKYSKIKQEKYHSFLKKVIMDSLFSGHSMHQIIFPIVKELNQTFIKALSAKMKDNIKIERFAINKELQIQGNYVRSMLLLNELDNIKHPKKVMDLLEKLKLQICNDIDLFHQLFKTEKNYKIDGDNFLGILCYLLCKLKPKLLDLYSQIAILSVIYGDNASVIFESASYMITSIQAAFDYFTGGDFDAHTN